jgi:NADPH2:quinone reductase
VSFAQGAALWIPYGTAYRALMQVAQAKAGETVLVHGASGGVGVAAVQIARAVGLQVIGTGGTEKGRKLALEQGAHRVVDHRAGDYLAEVLDFTGGKGVDVILEMLANVNLGRILPILARGGRAVVVGSRGTVEINPRDLMGRDARIIGMSMLTVTPGDAASIRAALHAGMENGTLRPVVGREMPLADAAKAHMAVMESGAFGKIVLIP